MRTKKTRGQGKRTAADRERHRQIREQYKDCPSQQELLATGDYEGPAPLGVFLEMRLAVAELRKARVAARLSLTQVAQRSGIDKTALIRLEKGLQANPTVETLCRYAAAVGKRMAWHRADEANFPALDKGQVS
jgi:DNA-binding XRE family transcriptional regulator